jgi:hypothetical protein
MGPMKAQRNIDFGHLNLGGGGFNAGTAEFLYNKIFETAAEHFSKRPPSFTS